MHLVSCSTFSWGPAARAVIVAAVVTGSLATSAFAGTVHGGAPTAPPATTVLGQVDGAPITEAEVLAQAPAPFEQLRTSYERERQHLEREYGERRHDLLQRQLDALLDRRALELEAKARQVSTEKVLAELPPPTAPTDADAQAFYAANQERIGQPYALMADKIREYLKEQNAQAAQRRFYDALRARHGIHASLAPYRLEVAADGPARGPADAPVTIVEFGDFQCPFCKAAEASLAEVMKRHAHSVRVVFRNLPLDQIHPNARVAAEAAVCAERHGKFWEMHDAMYADQRALDSASLTRTAAGLGLDEAQFSRCLADDSTRTALERDAAAADRLGLTGTPFFFINGRPLDGNVPVSQFEALIADELQRSGRAGE